MTAFSSFLEDEVLDHLLGGLPFTPQATVYCALFTTSTALDTNAPTGEVVGNAYARVAITFGSIASGGAISNSAAVDFLAASGGAWGDITHVAIVDSLAGVTWGTNVNVYFWGALAATRTINDTDVFSFAIGDLTVTLD